VSISQQKQTEDAKTKRRNVYWIESRWCVYHRSKSCMDEYA